MVSINESRQQTLSPGLAMKIPCVVATAGNIVLNGEQTIDGVACVEGDRVLVKNQTSAIDNGIYEVSTGSWNRTPDFDGAHDVLDGTIVLVRLGSNPFALYRAVSSDDPVIPGTSAITFALAGTSGDANNVTFLQSGAHAVQRTVTGKERDIVSLLDFGVVGDDVADDTQNISDAITDINAVANRPMLYAPAKTYLVTDQLTTIAGQFSLYGDGRQQTTFHFKPTADRALFKLANGAAQVINVSLGDFRIYSDDGAHTKVGIDIYDVSTCVFERIYIHGNGAGVGGSPAAGLYFSGGTGSIGMRTHGRDSSTIRDCEIIADYPLYFDANPHTVANDGEDLDHWHFTNLYLLASGHYNITMANGLGMENCVFDGFQAWVGGTGGIFVNDTRAAPTVYSHDIIIQNVRGEQFTDPNGYLISMAFAFMVDSLTIDNCFSNSSMQGINVTKVHRAHIRNFTAATANGKNAIVMTPSAIDSVVRWTGCYWQPLSVVTMTDFLPSIDAWDTALNQAPSEAVWTYKTANFGRKWYTIYRSAAAQTVGAGVVAETTLATITIPKKILGANGAIRIHTTWSVNNNANAKTLRVRYSGAAGTVFMSINAANFVSVGQLTQINNRNAVNAQIDSAPSINNIYYQGSVTALDTSAVDTDAADTTVVVTGQKANGADTLTLEVVHVEIVSCG